MLSEEQRSSLDTSNRHLSTSFSYVPPRATIFDLDSHELVSAIQTSVPNGSADIAIEFIQRENLSAQQFMNLRDLKLEELSDGNPTLFTELKAIRTYLPNSLRALTSPTTYRPSIWATFGEVEPAALYVRLRYHQITSRALEDTTHSLEPFDFGDDNDGHLGEVHNRIDAFTDIPGRNFFVPSISSSLGGAILGGRSILVNGSPPTVVQVSNSPGLHREFRPMNLVIQKECYMGADEDFPEVVPVQMASVSDPVPIPFPKQGKAPDMDADSDMPGGFRSDNNHIHCHDDLQVVYYLDKQVIGDRPYVDSGRDEITGHEAPVVLKDKNDADNHGSLDIGRTNRMHGEWHLATLPIWAADGDGPSSASEIQRQGEDDVDFVRGSQTPPGDPKGHFGADAAEDEKANPIESIQVSDLSVANGLTSISPNILHDFVDLTPGADEVVVFNDLVLVFIEQPYPSDLEHETTMSPTDHKHRSTPWDHCKLYLE